MLIEALMAAALAHAIPQANAILSPRPKTGAGSSFIVWREAPTQTAIDNRYPKGERGDGAVNVECDLAPTGRLEQCEVWSQAPHRETFKAAALSLTPLFLAPSDVTQVARANGAKVSLSIQFVDKRRGSGASECLPPSCTPVKPPPEH